MSDYTAEDVQRVVREWKIPSDEAERLLDVHGDALRVGATDGGTEQAPGTLILVNHGCRTTWHHSVSFDGSNQGHDHGTACGQAIDCDAIKEVRMELAEWNDLDKKSCCDECAGSVRSLAPNTEADP